MIARSEVQTWACQLKNDGVAVKEFELSFYNKGV